MSRSTVLHRATALAASVLLVAGAAGLTWWGGLDTSSEPAPVGGVTVPAPAGDTQYVCQAAPTNTLGAVDLGDTVAATLISPLSASASLTYRGQGLDPGGTTTTQEAAGGVLTVGPEGESAQGAVGAVTTSTADGDLRGLTSSACVPPSSVAWIVGGSSAVGSSTELRLTNPGATTSTATIHLYGSTGEIAMSSSGEVAVPAGRTVSVLLESAASTDDRLAVSIAADGGALAAALVTESLDGETAAGTDVLTAGAAPATDLTVPGVVLVEGQDQGEPAVDAAADAPTASRSPVVRLVNPGEQAATVSISTISADGEEPLAGAQSVVVDPGAVFDVSLAGVPAGAYGVHVTSDQPVAAAVELVRSAGEYPQSSGALLTDIGWSQAATPGDAQAGTLALPRGGGLSSTLTVTNSGAQDAALTLTATDGSWTQAVTVPAGTTATPAVPDGVEAVHLSAESAPGLSAATVVTASVQGEAAGDLIAVLPVVRDASALSERSVILR